MNNSNEVTSKPDTAQEAVTEPIYQYRTADGSWIDQAKHSYDYNMAHGHSDAVRVVYAAPVAAAPVVPVDSDAFDYLVDEVAAEHGEMLDDGGPSGWAFTSEDLVAFTRHLMNDYKGVLVADAYAIARAEAKRESTPAAPGIDPDVLEKAAIELWHRWGNDSVMEWEDETHKAEYRLAAEAVLALVDTSPKGGSDAVAWHSPNDLPQVSPGDMGWFWVAVRRANGITYNFPASYLNSMLLSDENGTADEPVVGNRYSHGAADEMEGSFPATGWHSAQEHSEYDNVYMPLLSDSDELLAWRAVDDFTIQTTSAEVKP